MIIDAFVKQYIRNCAIKKVEYIKRNSRISDIKVTNLYFRRKTVRFRVLVDVIIERQNRARVSSYYTQKFELILDVLGKVVEWEQLE